MARLVMMLLDESQTNRFQRVVDQKVRVNRVKWVNEHTRNINSNLYNTMRVRLFLNVWLFCDTRHLLTMILKE